MIKYDDLSADLIAAGFPELKERAAEEAAGYDEFPAHVVFGNVFNELTAGLLKRDDHSGDEMLRRIFGMYEKLASEGDNDTQDLVQVTLLEYLWDDKRTYSRAMEFMGEKTAELWGYIGAYIAVPKE